MYLEGNYDQWLVGIKVWLSFVQYVCVSVSHTEIKMVHAVEKE